ncbi:phosphocarrier protein Chr [Domibacillus antri]|uniref:Phosphocarrier protein Chr n=1 Tax=Domibacillus antri TaxID=1714264 RepID=A0A1Q8Q9G4_9BACI|nr:HPr family phosphocarrier protein [Domibacillus antri]OLN23977.1 phosphocarrier protein Chr [Domibacillus antri]
MVEKTVNVQLKSGLQARPAALFVQEANRFNAEIFLEKEGKKINAKSIMGIMSLALGRGTDVIISAEGRDAEEAVETLAELVEREEWV